MIVTTQWYEFSDQEKVAWLLTHVLKEDGVVPDDHVTPSYNLLLVNRCEHALNRQQRDKYITYMNSAIAAKTYEGLTDEQQQSVETADKFYWNYLTAEHDLRARCIWNVVADFAP